MHAFNVFDFLRDIVGKVPDLGGSEAEDRSATKRRLGLRSINQSASPILMSASKRPNFGFGFMSNNFSFPTIQESCR